MTDNLEELERLLAKAEDSDLADGGRYFAETCEDLTRCRHGEIGEYVDARNGEAIEALWNNRKSLIATAREVEGLRAEVAKLREVLIDVGGVLEIAARPSRIDPDRYFSEPVKAFGEAFGYGALMTCASALWREKLGDLAGGEFSAGICTSTASSLLARIEQTLADTAHAALEGKGG